MSGARGGSPSRARRPRLRPLPALATSERKRHTSPASCATPCASRAERHETSAPASGAATISVWPTGHPRAARGWGRGACGERCSTAPGHTRGAAAEPMAPRGAWWARGGRPCGRRASWRYVWHEVPINGRVINGPSAAGQSTRLSIMGCCNWLFRGSRGLTPWRRCQPGSGATRSEPVFPTKREGPARGRRRHTVAAEALVPPDAARVAIRIAPRESQQCTQMPRNGAKRPFSAICVHYCVPASVHNSATAQQCTQTPQSGAERPDPPICVHYCDPKATHNPSPRRNSVHKCPETAPRGHFHRFVYTPASVALAVRPTSP